MNRNIRRAEEALARIEEATADPKAIAAVVVCRRALEAMKPRKRIRQALPGPSRAEKRTAKRETHRKETAAIRAEVEKRAEGKCESCGGADDGRPLGRLEMHHVLGGIGRRRQMQAVENCMMVCRFCHGLLNGHPYGACNVVAWAERYGYPVPPKIRELADSCGPDAGASSSPRGDERPGTKEG